MTVQTEFINKSDVQKPHPADDIILFNTEDALKTEAPKQHIPTFQLVPELDPILSEVLPEFSFDEAPINANDFALLTNGQCGRDIARRVFW